MRCSVVQVVDAAKQMSNGDLLAARNVNCNLVVPIRKSERIQGEQKCLVLFVLREEPGPKVGRVARRLHLR
jgi:hypothetical protein